MTKPSKFADMSADELRKILAQKEAEETRLKEVIERKKAYEQNRDKHLQKLHLKFSKLHHELKALKAEALEAGNELYTEMMKVYGKEGEKPNTFTLENELGTIKLEIENQERLAFDETITAGITMIKEVIGKLSRKTDSFTHNALMSTLVKNKKGDFDPKIVAKLKSDAQYIKNEDHKAEFMEGLQIIQDAQYVSDTARYVRMYEREPETEKFEVIQMQFSTL